MGFTTYYAPNNRGSILFSRGRYDLVTMMVVLHGRLETKTDRAHEPDPAVETHTFAPNFAGESFKPKTSVSLI